MTAANMLNGIAALKLITIDVFVRMMMRQRPACGGWDLVHCWALPIGGLKRSLWACTQII